MRRCLLASSWHALVLFAACETPPNAPPLPNTVYLLGRFSAPHDRAQFAAELRQRGYRIANDLDDSVDTVVIGMPPLDDSGEGFVVLEESAEYRRAVRRNLRLLSPQEAQALPVR